MTLRFQFLLPFSLLTPTPAGTAPLLVLDRLESRHVAQGDFARQARL